MRRSSLLRQRLLAVGMGGVLLWYSPIINLFDSQELALGIPLLYLYLFGTWAMFIAILAVIAEYWHR